MSVAHRPSRALCRAIPDTFDRAVVRTAPAETIRVDIARRQHLAYVRALESLGVAVIVLPADPRYPDCCFVEDSVVVAGETALITRLGAPSRRGEEAAVAAALQSHLRLATTAAPATLDGGDCLRLGQRLYVGQSQRTNAAGIHRLREVLTPTGLEIIEVPLDGFLHLKCVCSRLNDDTMLLADRSIPPEVFRDVQIIKAPAEEGYAANCLCRGATVLLPAGFPATRRTLEKAGWRVQELEMSEIRKADGALTCLSVLF